MDNGNVYSWQYLVERYFAGTISGDELEELLRMAKKDHRLGQLTDPLKHQWDKAKEAKDVSGINWDEQFEMMMAATREASVPLSGLPPKSKISRWVQLGIAASVLVMFAVGLLYLLGKPERKNKPVMSQTHQQQNKIDLEPGSNGAVLTLADGRKIVLDSAGNGVLAVQGRTRVINNNGKLIYDRDKLVSDELMYNTISTAKGKQYQLTLSDGSRVWLNAASSIRFPAVFKATERKVEITGEAYFEVAHAAGTGKSLIPFIVEFKTPSDKSGEVQVLGTHFNVNAYEDERAARTTLLEGSVKVSLSDGVNAMLMPGQQASISNTGHLNVHDNIDVDAVVAWKNGYFSFSKTDMATLMRQISRWYDVEVEYAGAIPDRTFGGEISRSSNASQVLKIMEESKVHFKIEGKKIIVLP